MEKIELLAQLLNESLQKQNLPELSEHKTKVFVKMNQLLKKFTPEEFIYLVDDYGLVLPTLVLADVNVDYAILLQNQNKLNIDGFVAYLDVFFIRMTSNNKNIMLDFTNFDSKHPNKELRRQYIEQTLEDMIDTKGLTNEELIEQLLKNHSSPIQD